MKIARNNDKVNLTLTKAEWQTLGKVAGWAEDIDPDLVPQDGFEEHRKLPKGILDSNEHLELEPEIDNPQSGTSPGEDPAAIEAPMGDTFLNNDPNAPEVDTAPQGADELGLGQDAEWQSTPQQSGDYTMTTDGADGLGQDVYYDGKGQLFFGDDQIPHQLEKIMQSHPGVKFKLRPVTEPDSDIPDGHGSMGSPGPLDTKNAPF